jgi:uncharacterized membrane protein
LYKLYEQTTDNFGLAPYRDNSVHSCRHILVENQWINNNSSIRFPYATKLTLAGDYAAEIPSLVHNLNSIISVAQITELVLDYTYLFMYKLFQILRYVPNINSLTIPQTALIQSHILTENENETIRILSKKSHITKVMTTGSDCTLKQVRFLFNLCPQIEYLTMDLAHTNAELIMQFLITKMKENNYRFCLCVIPRWNSNNELTTKIYSALEQEKLLDNHSINYLDGTIHLWC